MQRKRSLQPAQIILLGFLGLILLGSLLLTLPAAHVPGETTRYVDALFTATTSVCVTGLTVVSTAGHWSLFGQIVILILIQLGGLGVVTSMMVVLATFHRKIGLKNRILIQTAYGWNSMYGVGRMVVRIVIATLIVELAGMICYLPVLTSSHGAHGIWESLFLSVSAFCNAGMDITGDSSLLPYAQNAWMNGVTAALIIIGGLGFLVWWEIGRLIRERRREKCTAGQIVSRMTLHAKIVLSTTIFLLLAGMILVLLLEYDNPGTLGQFGWPGKVLAAFFQSVTTRTAGFYTISQSAMRDSTSLVCMLFMFIGGSPGGTAGGVKTVTVAMVFFAVLAAVRGRKETRAFRRSISGENVRKGLAIIMLSLSIWAVLTILFLRFEDGSFIHMSYETMSAIGTVGLSKDITPTLHTAGKIIIILMMYLGRVGPITMAAAFLSRPDGSDTIHLPEENIMLG